MSDLSITGRSKMARVIGVTVQGLIVMEQRGLPVLKRGSGSKADANVYDLTAVWQWLKADQERKLIGAREGESTKDLAIRRAKAEARKAEIEVAKLEGALVDVEMVRRGLQGLFLNQRTILLALPPQVGRDIDQPDVRVRVVQIVERRVREALEAIAAYDPVTSRTDADGTGDDSDQDGTPADSSAAETDREPVGRTKTVSQPRRRRQSAVAQRDSPVLS
jgi:phage terminase Nu1 subunit (DNA packaging protein)